MKQGCAHVPTRADGFRVTGPQVTRLFIAWLLDCQDRKAKGEKLPLDMWTMPEEVRGVARRAPQRGRKSTDGYDTDATVSRPTRKRSRSKSRGASADTDGYATDGGKRALARSISKRAVESEDEEVDELEEDQLDDEEDDGATRKVVGPSRKRKSVDAATDTEAEVDDDEGETSTRRRVGAETDAEADAEDDGEPQAPRRSNRKRKPTTRGPSSKARPSRKGKGKAVATIGKAAHGEDGDNGGPMDLTNIKVGPPKPAKRRKVTGVVPEALDQGK